MLIHVELAVLKSMVHLIRKLFCVVAAGVRVAETLGFLGSKRIIHCYLERRKYLLEEEQRSHDNERSTCQWRVND